MSEEEEYWGRPGGEDKAKEEEVKDDENENDQEGEGEEEDSQEEDSGEEDEEEEDKPSVAGNRWGFGSGRRTGTPWKAGGGTKGPVEGGASGGKKGPEELEFQRLAKLRSLKLSSLPNKATEESSNNIVDWKAKLKKTPSKGLDDSAGTANVVPVRAGSTASLGGQQEEVQIPEWKRKLLAAKRGDISLKPTAGAAPAAVASPSLRQPQDRAPEASARLTAWAKPFPAAAGVSGLAGGGGIGPSRPLQGSSAGQLVVACSVHNPPGTSASDNIRGQDEQQLKWSELDRKNASRYAKELALLKAQFEKEDRLRKNAVKNLNRAHKALAAAMKEFDIARDALIGLEEQLSGKRGERAQERIITLEHYLSVEMGGGVLQEGEEGGEKEKSGAEPDRRLTRARSMSRERSSSSSSRTDTDEEREKNKEEEAKGPREKKKAKLHSSSERRNPKTSEEDHPHSLGPEVKKEKHGTTGGSSGGNTPGGKPDKETGNFIKRPSSKEAPPTAPSKGSVIGGRLEKKAG